MTQKKRAQKGRPSEDEKDFNEWYNTTDDLDIEDFYSARREAFLAGRRTLRKKIKADPSIGKLVVEGE